MKALLKISILVGLGYCILYISQTFAQQAPYTPNLRDSRTIEKAEDHIRLLASSGDKERLAYIIGMCQVELAKLQDAKSQRILFETKGLAEEYFPHATEAYQTITQGSGSISTTSGTQEPATIETGASQTITPSSLNDSGVTTTYLESGIASYYGKSFDGRRTANGDTLNNEELTAAHKTLPFNTRVKVINKKNQHRVIVRINDRGPFIEGRVIDLTQAAFKALNNGSLSAGILNVEVEEVNN